MSTAVLPYLGQKQYSCQLLTHECTLPLATLGGYVSQSKCEMVNCRPYHDITHAKKNHPGQNQRLLRYALHPLISTRNWCVRFMVIILKWKGHNCGWFRFNKEYLKQQWSIYVSYCTCPRHQRHMDDLLLCLLSVVNSFMSHIYLCTNRSPSNNLSFVVLVISHNNLDCLNLKKCILFSTQYRCTTLS